MPRLYLSNEMGALRIRPQFGQYRSLFNTSCPQYGQGLIINSFHPQQEIVKLIKSCCFNTYSNLDMF